MVAYDEALEVLATRLSPEALAHSSQVADTAADLAMIYGVDVESARLAGLLHDWDRERSHDELLAEASGAGIAIDPSEENRPYLLHARTGAAGVRAAFPGISEEVVRAISLHTMGAPQMSELDMIVWVADMIEPERSFPGVDALREVAGTVSLKDLFAAGYARSVAHLVEKRKVIHPDTVAVWNTLVARSRP